MFWELLRRQRVKKIYFTGMLIYSQSNYFMHYIFEVKIGNQIEDAVVQANKDFAQQIALASGMEYQTIKSSDADKRHYRVLLKST